jgi:hypothetical protein
MRNYSSYLVRRWLLGEEYEAQQQLFEIEHIQTGSSARVNSLSEAEEWFASNCAENLQLDEADGDLESSSPASNIPNLKS